MGKEREEAIGPMVPLCWRGYIPVGVSHGAELMVPPHSTGVSEERLICLGRTKGLECSGDFGKKDNRQVGEMEVKDVEAGILRYEHESVSLSADRHDI